jgi:putative hydrolase of the HAD superfamily
MDSRTATAVTFDAGNTLLYCDPSPAEIYARELSRLGRPVNADDVGPVFAQAWSEMQKRTEAGRDRYSSVAGGERAWWGAFIREVLVRLDHDAPWEPLLDDLYAAFADPEVWKTYPETAITLGELTRRGVPLAVISNWDRRLPEILDSLGILDFFQAVIVSAIEGIEKPSPEIFHRALARLDLEAHCVLHVGDSPLEDYRGAEGAGLTPVLLDRQDIFNHDGYRRIRSLDEVIDLVG